MPRRGTYSPNGTLRTFRSALVTSPSGVTTTWALTKLSSTGWAVNSESTVTPTANGTPSRAASAATRELLSLPANGAVDVDAVLRPDHQVELVVGLDRGGRREVGARAPARLGTSSALVPCRPPPCTAAIVSGAPSSSRPVGATTERADEHDDAASAVTPWG